MVLDPHLHSLRALVIGTTELQKGGSDVGGGGAGKGAVHGSKHAPRLAAAESQADFFIFLFYFDGEHPALMKSQPGKWLMARI